MTWSLLPHGWVATYEVHSRRLDREGSPRIVLIALTRLDEALDF